MKPRVLDLFSGIGGFALAFEAAGFETHAFAEIEPYPCKILAQHWPEVPNLGDVKGINGEKYRGAIDVVCGGFPCQDISLAGKGAGIDGARSGLWSEMLRIIRGAQPAFCLLENVPALKTRGGDRVLGDLEEAGYSCRAFVVGAVHAGANHRRQRAWIMAYAMGGWVRRGREGSEAEPVYSGSPMADTKGQPIGSGLCPDGADWVGRGRFGDGGSADNAPDTRGAGLEVGQRPEGQWAYPAITGSDWWATEPDVGRVANGIPQRAHRIKALGNSIVPAVAYPFACWIKAQLEAQA